MTDIKPVRFAQKDDLEHLSELFNAYRCFYGRASDLQLAARFLSERFEQKNSVIFVAETENIIVGFTQLYPTFSSVSAKRAWILNDLFVAEGHRGNGIARQLIHRALEFCRENGAAWLSLQTGRDNVQAQALYEGMGFLKENHFIGFSYEFQQET